MNSKPFYKSKTLWGIVLAGIGLAGQLADALDADQTQLLIGLGLGLAGLGRVVAENELTVR